MMLFIRKKLPSSFIICSLGKTNAFNLLPSSFLASAIRNPPPRSDFMAEYLMNSCGFSPEKAARASKSISHLTSSLKPESVRHFLKHHGFADTEIRSLISNYPPILCGDVDRNMEPNLRSLREMGFAEEDLRKLIIHNPQALQLASVVPRIEFWHKILNGDMKRLVLAFTRNQGLINKHIDKGAATKIAVLKDYGIDQTGIGVLVARACGLMRMNTDSMESVIKRVQVLGFRRGSPMFVRALSCLSGLSSDTLKEKMELYKSFGWSEEELLSAIKKTPSILALSEGNIREKMAFLVERGGCSQGYIALHPIMLSFSLQKRLVPRNHIMKILKSNGLGGKKWSLYSTAALSEKDYVDKFILPYKDKLPMLFETYVSARAGKIAV